MKNQNTYIILIVLVLGGLAGYVIYVDISSDAQEKPPIAQVEESIPNEVLTPEGTGVPNESVGTHETTPTPIPNLDRAITNANEEMISQIKDLIALLKQDANLFNEWIGLGILRKEIEDYEGAQEAWEYAGAIRPFNSVSFVNLGTLYGYYLQNTALAEQNYLKAIENDPKLPYLYMQAADFYLEVLKNKEKAREILEKGLREIPNDEALNAALGNIEVGS